jgi:hypothetical protein
MPDVRRLHRLPLFLLLTAGLGAVGVACSGSGSGGGSNAVASLKAAADQKTTDTSAKPGKTDPEDAALNYARCMRDHGVDMPDPDTSGGPGIVKFGGPNASSLDMTKFQDADKACHDILGSAAPQKPTPAQQQQMQDQALAFSRCMRKHGIDMPDPTFGADGGMTMKIDSGSGIDPSDPKFTAAQQACGSAFGPGGATMSAGSSVAVGGGKGGASGGSGGVMVFGGTAGATASAGGGK